MVVAGIIAEYNPFHNGHAYQIDRTRAEDGGCAATHVIAVMSGNFVQRGGPACMPKQYRALMALKNGADLVIELPVPWSVSSAGSFADGAVSILNALGCVDYLSFGSEVGDVSKLEKVSDILMSEKFENLLSYYMSFGHSYPVAREKAVSEIAGEKTAEIIKSPNNILATEYINAIKKLHSGMKPYTVKRFGAGYHDLLPQGDIASASFIRTLMYEGRNVSANAYVPANIRNIIQKACDDGAAPAKIQNGERAILAVLRTMSVADIKNISGISEGLENRIFEAISAATSWDDLCKRIKTKRYTMTRVHRTLISAFLKIDNKWANLAPPYIRVLGLNDRGAEILRKAKSTNDGSAPIITKISQLDASTSSLAHELFNLEAKSTDLYSLLLPKILPCCEEFRHKILRA